MSKNIKIDRFDDCQGRDNDTVVIDVDISASVIISRPGKLRAERRGKQLDQILSCVLPRIYGRTKRVRVRLRC